MTPEQKTAKRVYMKQWQREHASQIREAKAEQYRSLPWAQRNRMAGATRGKLELSVEVLQHLYDTTEVCSVPGCGVTLDYNRSAKQQPNQAAVDKVIPSRGYIEDNVRIICRACNSTKVHGTPKDWMRFTQYVLSHERSRLGNTI